MNNEIIGKRQKERRVTYQHEDTGNLFTKLIPENEPIPQIPRRFVVSITEENPVSLTSPLRERQGGAGGSW
jgi:hypothetical protein